MIISWPRFKTLFDFFCDISGQGRDPAFTASSEATKALFREHSQHRSIAERSFYLFPDGGPSRGVRALSVL